MSKRLLLYHCWGVIVRKIKSLCNHVGKVLPLLTFGKLGNGSYCIANFILFFFLKKFLPSFFGWSSGSMTRRNTHSIWKILKNCKVISIIWALQLITRRQNWMRRISRSLFIPEYSNICFRDFLKLILFVSIFNITST